MKKVLRYLLVGLMAACLGFCTFFLYKTTTPEFALYQTYKDIQRDGFEGLERHITAEMAEELEKAITMTPQSQWEFSPEAFRMISHRLLAKYIRDTKWSIREKIIDGKRVKVKLECTYPKGRGVITLMMRKDGWEWKISAAGMLNPMLDPSPRIGCILTIPNGANHDD